MSDGTFAEVATIGKEIILFLHCEPGKYATKRFIGEERKVQKPNTGIWWTPEVVSVRNLWEAFEQFYSRAEDPTCCFVRGILTDQRLTRILRRHRPHKDAPKPHIRGTKRHLHCIDIDNIQVPGIDRNDPEEGINKWVRSIPAFRNADFFVQLSSSWGIKDGICIHLWYWSENKMTDVEAKEFSIRLPFHIDPKVYSPSQPHYFADPVFEQCEYPAFYGPRWWFSAADTGDGEVHIDTGAPMQELDYWVDRIRNIDAGAPRHDTINSAGYFLGKYVRAGVWTSEELTCHIVDACTESGAFEDERIRAAEDEIRRAVDDGIRDGDDYFGSWKEGLQRNDDGKIKSTTYNLLKVLREHPSCKGLLRYDVRAETAELVFMPPWNRDKSVPYPRPVSDSDEIEALSWVNLMGMTFSTSMVHSCLNTVAADTKHDECVEYVKALPQWDGLERCMDLFTMGIGVTPTQWAFKQGLMFMDGLISRILAPGTKVDFIPILYNSKEGVGKSTFFKELIGAIGEGNKYFSDAMGPYHDNKAFAEAIGRHLIIEDPELTAFFGRDLEHVKRQASAQEDKYRPPYAHRYVHKPRRCMLVSSTNRQEILDPSMENRRFPVLSCGEIDLDWVRSQREQIFAEAKWRFENRLCKPWIDRDEIEAQKSVMAANNNFMGDPWQDSVDVYLRAKLDRDGGYIAVTASQALCEAIGVPLSSQDKGKAARMGAVLRACGCIKRSIREHGAVVSRYVKEG